MSTLKNSRKVINLNKEKSWATLLFFPSPEQVKDFLSVTRIRFISALVWLFAANIFYATVSQVISPADQQNAFTAQNFMSFIGEIILASIMSLLGSILFCGSVHIIAKVFGKSGRFQDFFIVYSLFVIPFIVTFGLVSIVWFLLYPLVVFTVIVFGGYCLLWLNTVAIESVYDFARWKAFFINLVALVVMLFSGFALYINGLL